MLLFNWMTSVGRNSRFAGFAGNRSGATAIEYALIAAFIAIAIVVSAPAIGVSVNALFTIVSGNL